MKAYMYIYIYYLIIFSLERGIYWRASEHLQDKISKHKDLNKFYKDYCRGLTTESDILQNCSFCEVWSVYSGQYLSKIIQRKNRGHGWPRLIDTSGELRLAHVVRQAQLKLLKIQIHMCIIARCVCSI